MNRYSLIPLLAIVILCTAVHGQLLGDKRTQHPNFSPDGKLIVFSATVTKGSDDVSKGISVMNADGSQVRLVTASTPGVFDEFPSLSRDGKRIVFLRRAGREASNVFIVKSDGTGLTQLTNTPERELRPEFNHDDTAVVFVRDFSPNVSNRFGSLHSVEIATKKEQQILAREYQVSHAVAAPRGLYFAALAKLDAEGKPLDVITNGNTITLVSPTGEISPKSPVQLPSSKAVISRVQFANMGREFVVYAQSGGWSGKAFVITTKGAETFEESDYSLSPDGTKLVKWGGGSSVYIKDLRAERGVAVGAK